MNLELEPGFGVEDLPAPPSESQPGQRDEEPEQPKPKKPRTSASKGAPKTRVNEEPSDGTERMKKCKRCKKSKALSDFYQNQAGCKQCSKDMRNFENHARNCKEVEWARSLDDAEKDALLVAYGKEREKAEKERTKLKFSMTNYKQRTVHAQGVRKEGRRRFMTEQGYYAWSRTPEGGSKTQKQAEEKWQEMLNDPKVPSQGTGVEFQLAVHMFDDLIDYDDHGRQREIEQQARLNNKMSADELSRKTDLLVTAGVNVAEAAEDKIRAAMADSDIAKEGVVLPQVSMLVKRKASIDGEDADADMTPLADTKKEEPEPAGSPKWFDSAAEHARAQRQLDAFISKKKSAMVSLVTNMKETLDVARMAVANKSATKDCMLEMKILHNRLLAVEIVVTGSADDFSAHVVKLKSDAPSDTKSQVSAQEKGLMPLGSSLAVFPSLYDLICFFM